jgi:hypothetical protein
MYRYVVCVNQIPDIVELLKAKGKEHSFAVFMFDTNVKRGDGIDDTLNLQYAVNDRKVGFEWVLLGQRNKADKDQIAKFAARRGHTVHVAAERLTTSKKDRDLPPRQGRKREEWTVTVRTVRYLRVEDGDIAKLGVSVVTKLYKNKENDKISLLVSGFGLLRNWNRMPKSA